MVSRVIVGTRTRKEIVSSSCRDVDRRPENEDEQPMPKSLVRLIRSMEGVNRGDRTKKGERNGCDT